MGPGPGPGGILSRSSLTPTCASRPRKFYCAANQPHSCSKALLQSTVQKSGHQGLSCANVRLPTLVFSVPVPTPGFHTPTSSSPCQASSHPPPPQAPGAPCPAVPYTSLTGQVPPPPLMEPPPASRARVGSFLYVKSCDPCSLGGRGCCAQTSSCWEGVLPETTQPERGVSTGTQAGRLRASA